MQKLVGKSQLPSTMVSPYPAVKFLVLQMATTRDGDFWYLDDALVLITLDLEQKTGEVYLK